MSIDRDTLIYNSQALEDLSGTLGKNYAAFNEAVEAMFDIIDNKMNAGDHWSGPTYQDLKDKCDNFRKTRIETMGSNLKAYVDHFHKTSEESETTTNNVRGIVTSDALENAKSLKNDIQNQIGSYLK